MEENNFRTSKEVLEDEIIIEKKLIDWQKILIPMSAIFFLYVFGLLILTFIMNTNTLKETFNTNMQTLLQTNSNIKPSIQINGNISFNSFLLPHLTIKNIKGTNLIKDNYQLDFNIKEIRLYISARHLFMKKIVIKKTEVVYGNFNIKEINNTENINTLDKVIQDFSDNLLSKKYINIDFIKSNFYFENNNYNRSLENINLSNIIGQNRLDIVGTLLSNKQPLGIELYFKANKKNGSVKLNLFSQAFNFKLNSKIDMENKIIQGKSIFDIINLQIFTKTVFNSNSFLYKRIIDNSNLKGNFDFNCSNDIINISNINLNGKNLQANGEIKINLLDKKTNIINFNIDFADLDNLIIKNFINKNNSTINEDNIFIFSGKKLPSQKKNDNKTYIQRLFIKNQNNFNINIKTLKLNQSTLSNATLKFSYLNNNKLVIDNISLVLPGNTKMLMQKTIDNKTSIAMSGNNLYELWDFLKNTKYTKNNVEKKFALTGFFELVDDTIFLNNIKFNTNNIETNSTAEIGLNSGISYIAIDSNISTLILDSILQNNKNETNKIQNNLLKNKMLFLNNFSINSFLKFNINKLKYKNLLMSNYNFTIKTSQGVLNIIDINLNNEIKGNINFDIRKNIPILEILLNIENHIFENDISISNLIFKIPTLQDYSGKIEITGKNSKFKNSTLNNFSISTNIDKGIIDINNFNINGFGGECKITGFLDLNYNKKLNLVFNACTADLHEILYLFTNNNNISGLIGFSAIIYSQGNSLNNFLNNYIYKIQMIGSGVEIKNFGLEELNNTLIKLNTIPELAFQINSEKLLINSTKTTTFNNLSGNIQYINKKGQIDLDISKPLINGKITGSFEFLNNKFSLNSYANFIMLAGTLNNTINLTLPMSIAGMPENGGLRVSANYQQINDYINTIKSVK